MVEFNFLPVKKVLSEKELHTQRRLAIIGGVFFSLVLIFSVIVGGYAFYDATTFSQLEGRRKALSAEIEQNKDKIASLTSLHNRIQSVTYIINSQFDYSRTIRTFLGLLPSGVSLQSLKINKLGFVDATLVASDSGSLANFMANFTNPALNYKEIQLGNLSRRENAVYQISVTYRLFKKTNEAK